jgi:Protein of unknown function
LENCVTNADHTSDTATDPAPELDSLILACASQDWQRVTMLIAATFDASRANALDASAQTIAGRIYALTDAHQLEAKGNVRRWRSGEIRRKAA